MFVQFRMWLLGKGLCMWVWLLVYLVIRWLEIVYQFCLDVRLGVQVVIVSWIFFGEMFVFS